MEELGDNLNKLTGLKSRCKATATQLSYMAEFMKNHPKIASGLVGQSLQDRVESEKTWAKLTAKLNGLGGPIKPASKWKQTWRDMRSNNKRKIVNNRAEYQSNRSCSTINGPSKLKQEDVMSTEVIKETNSPASSPTSDMDPFPILSQPSTSTDRLPTATASSSDEESTASKNQPTQCQKRKRLAKRVDNFANKLLKLKKLKLQVQREHNTILLRLVNTLQDISHKLDK